MWLGECLLGSLPRYPTLLWKSAWSSQLACWEWEKACGQLCPIFDPFKFCSAHDRIPSLTCPGVAGPSPCFLPVGREDFCRGVSTEVLPCSHPAFGDTRNFAKPGGCCPRNRINPAYLFLFILLKHETFALYNHPCPALPRGALPAPSRVPIQRGGASVIPKTSPSLGKGELWAGFYKT